MKIFGSECPPEIQDRLIETYDGIRPRVLPANWKQSLRVANGGQWDSMLGLRVMQEVEWHQDNGMWLHVSVSRRSRMPDYDDLVLVKRMFIGPERRALMFFAKESEHFNFHKFCLHLFAPLDGATLPDDFRTKTGEL